MARTTEGIVRKHREGFGFLIQPKGTDDVYIPAEDLVGVMDGDRIQAQMFKRRGRLAGRLLAIVERGRRVVIGVYKEVGGRGWVEPSDPGLHEDIMARVACEPAPQEGQRVKLVLTEWPTGVSPAKGEVVDVYGDEADPLQEVLAMAYSRGFSDTFPADVMGQAGAVADHVGIGDLAGRRDLRSLPLVTIDGEDAKDFDDAVFVEHVPGGGYRLVVAIADVVHYVREGTPLDQEALSRATSVYFPGMVLPMLPEQLSNGICSLLPDEDRLCMVADLTLTEGGKTINTEIYEAVMRSHARLTYDDVADMMRDSGLGPETGSPPPSAGGGNETGKSRRRPGRGARRKWQEEVLPAAVELSEKLHKRRASRGCIDFDLPEAYVVLDENNFPARITARERLWPHRLVEEFMLAANEAVAFFFHRHGLPTIYRVHGEPDELKLASFATLARAHGFTMEPGRDIPSRKINEFLHSLVGRPEQRTLNHLLLRAMQQAIYSSENIGHYGLAAPHYLHFTSPIRRYPDLMVHRLLKSHWRRAGRSPTPAGRQRTEQQLEKIAGQASERERAAVEAERESGDYFAALYMKDRVGEDFEASVASVTAFGLFVELPDAHVQGLVKLESLGHGAVLDEARMRIVLPGSGRSYTLGDKLRVICSSVSVARRQITFEPKEGAIAPVEEPRRRRGRGARKAAAVAPSSQKDAGGRQKAKPKEEDAKAPSRRRRKAKPKEEDAKAPSGRRPKAKPKEEDAKAPSGRRPKAKPKEEDAKAPSGRKRKGNKRKATPRKRRAVRGRGR